VYTLADPATITCTPTLIVEFPISVTQAAQVANLNDINQALQDGFDLKWTGNYEDCLGCVASGGMCGNDGGTGFRCFCKDGPYINKCGSEKVKSSTKSK
jgi:hypothetical protein